MKRVAVLISGRGSNLGALIAAARAADYPARIALVIAKVAQRSGGANDGRRQGPSPGGGGEGGA